VPEPHPKPGPAPHPKPAPEPAPAPDPCDESPKAKDISNVVFYLSDGDHLVGVKLDYQGVGIKDYRQPWKLTGRIEDAVNASAKLEGFAVVGFSVKAGQEIHEFGTTYDQFGNTGGNPALAEGKFNGSVRIDSKAIGKLAPIDLLAESPAALARASGDVLPGDDSAPEHVRFSDRGDSKGPAQTLRAESEDGPTAIADTAGDTQLHGTFGADVFKWKLAEPGMHDTISDFRMAPPAKGGDVLDLRDLLPPESAANLDSYLRFEDSGRGGTLLCISTAGEFSGNASHDAGVAHQIIELANVDLLSLGSSHQIIESLVNQNKLITG
jgi:hypothetical protein